MYVYIARRLLLFIPTIILVSIISFLLLRVVPGDPAVARLIGPTGTADFTRDELMAAQKKLGTDRPLVVQYFDWSGGLLTGDLGRSMFDDSKVNGKIARGLPISVELAIGAIVISLALAIPLGIVSAVYQNTWIDYVGRFVAITGITVPLFVFAIMILFVLVTVFNWLPPPGYNQIWEEPWTNIKQMVFPIVALSFTRIGYMARITRSGMLDVLREDYVRTARSKGLRETLVINRHALRNALLPVLTLSGFQFAVLLGGTVIIERIFRLPGMGETLLDGIGNRDFTVVQGVVMTMIGAILIINLIVDLLYGVLDPRIRYG